MPKPKLKDLQKRNGTTGVAPVPPTPPAAAAAYETLHLSIAVPIAPPVPASNIPRTLNTSAVYLRPAEGEALKRLSAGLNAANERTAAGRHVGPHHGRAIQWLLERLAESMKVASDE